MRPQPVASRDVGISTHDLFKISGYSRVGEEVVGNRGGEVDQQVDIAVLSILCARDGAEYRDVDHAALPKFHFVGAEVCEDTREQGHAW